MERDINMRIDVYLDDEKTPFDRLESPKKFKLDTSKIEDGEHRLTFKAYDKKGVMSVRVVPFNVHNGPSIAIHGIEDNENISGEISILANAFSSHVGDEFEPINMETPAPIPTWAWVLFICVITWGAGYVALEVGNKSQFQFPQTLAQGEQSAPSPDNDSKAKSLENDWKKIGEQVYGNNCASCHQGNGTGVPSVFPPLKDNTVVISDDPSEHIMTVINGLSNKTIDGVPYASPMPAFGTMLTDEEIAAVVNHERTNWGNNGKTVSAEDVGNLR